MAFTAKQAHAFSQSLGLTPEKALHLGSRLCLVMERYSSPQEAFAFFKSASRQRALAIKEAKASLIRKGFKGLICHHHQEVITAVGWQLSGPAWGNLDRYGNGRYIVGERGYDGWWTTIYGEEL